MTGREDFELPPCVVLTVVAEVPAVPGRHQGAKIGGKALVTLDQLQATLDPAEVIVRHFDDLTHNVAQRAAIAALGGAR